MTFCVRAYSSAARRSESRCCIAGLAYSEKKAKMPRSSRCWSSDCGDGSLAAFCSRRSSPSRTAARPPTADQLRHPPAHRHRFYSPRCAACSVLFAFQRVPAQKPQHQISVSSYTGHVVFTPTALLFSLTIGLSSNLCTPLLPLQWHYGLFCSS